MGTLTVAQIARFRRKIGDVGTPPAFDNAELQDIYDEAGSNFNAAVRDAFVELQGNAWRFTNYTQNASSEQKRQIFENLGAMVAYWEAKVKQVNQMRIVGSKINPPKARELPSGESSFDDPPWTKVIFPNEHP